MESFENSAAIVSIKSELREIFISVIDTVRLAFVSFYEWLKSVPIPTPPSVMKMFGNNKANVILFFAFVIYVMYINIKAYVLFSVDKFNSERYMKRIPEKQLFKYMWLGGAPGAGLAMLIMRHKTKHMNFVITAFALIFMQLMVFSFILGFLGFWTFF